MTGDAEEEPGLRPPLYDTHGRPARYPDTAAALTLLGVRGQIHPRDAMAWIYRDQAAADAYAAANAADPGAPSLGTVPCDGGVLGALDLRPVLPRGGATDPSLPDDWEPAPRRRP